MGEMVDPDVLLAAEGVGSIDISDSMPDGARARSTTTYGWTVPLWLARRTACLNVLRREGVRSCVEFGCGSGSVLSVCTAPAWSLDDFPGLYPPSLSTEDESDRTVHDQRRARKMDVLRSVPRVDPEKNELHLRRLAGVDVRPESLRQAIELTAPPDAPAEDDIVARERWEELAVELWEGGIETYNEAFDNVDGIIVTEVIEHLSAKALEKAEQLLLGVYAPRVLIVTTPNYSFNPYFVPHDGSNEHTVKDPTGRTNRAFRDEDHQFEFTRDEFRAWANKLARENDYSVTFSGVGSLAEYYAPEDPPERPPSIDAHPELAGQTLSDDDASSFYATQIAIFKRQLSYESERSPRSHRMQPLPFMTALPPPVSAAVTTTLPSDSPYRSKGTSTNGNGAGPAAADDSPPFVRQALYPLPHILRKTHVHKVHPSAQISASSSTITNGMTSREQQQQGGDADLLELCRLYLDYSTASPRSAATLGEFWTVSAVRRACAGTVGHLVDAAVESDEWDLELVGELNDLGQPARGMDALRLVHLGSS